VFRLHIWARRCMHGQRLRTILTAMSHEEHSMLCGVACRTNESVMLETTDHRIVRDHVGQNQLSAARPTMHCSHVYRTSPVARIIDFGPAAVQVRLWICSRRARTGTSRAKFVRGVPARGTVEAKIHLLRSVPAGRRTKPAVSNRSKSAQGNYYRPRIHADRASKATRCVQSLSLFPGLGSLIREATSKKRRAISTIAAR
jgi:hypothetical protein